MHLQKKIFLDFLRPHPQIINGRPLSNSYTVLVKGFVSHIIYMKYTNPARGILNFCKQRFYRPLLCYPWALCADFSGTERVREKEQVQTIKGPLSVRVYF